MRDYAGDEGKQIMDIVNSPVDISCPSTSTNKKRKRNVDKNITMWRSFLTTDDGKDWGTRFSQYMQKLVEGEEDIQLLRTMMEDLPVASKNHIEDDIGDITAKLLGIPAHHIRAPLKPGNRPVDLCCEKYVRELKNITDQKWREALVQPWEYKLTAQDDRQALTMLFFVTNNDDPIMPEHVRFEWDNVITLIINHFQEFNVHWGWPDADVHLMQACTDANNKIMALRPWWRANDDTWYHGDLLYDAYAE